MNDPLTLSLFVFFFLYGSFWIKLITFILFVFYQYMIKRFHKKEIFFLLFVVILSLNPFVIRNNCILETHENYVVASIHHRKVLIYTDELYFENERVEGKGELKKITSLSNFHLFDFQKKLALNHVYYYYDQKDVTIHKKNSLMRKMYEYIMQFDETMTHFLKEVFYGFSDRDLILSSGLHYTSLNQLFLSGLSFLVCKKYAYAGSSLCLILISRLFPFHFSIQRILLGNLLHLFDNLSSKQRMGYQALICMFLNPSCVFKPAFILPYFLGLIHQFHSSKFASMAFLAFYQFYQFHDCMPLYLFIFPLIRKIDMLSFVMGFMITLCPLKQLAFLFDSFFHFFMNFVNSFHFYGHFSIIFTIIFLFFFCFSFEKKKLLRGSFLVLLLNPFQSYLNPFYEVVMINVGQGDCFLIRAPFNQSNILIDLPLNQEKRVADYLHAIGINKIDYLVFTHADSDHNGGKEAFLDIFSVNQIIEDQKDIKWQNHVLYSINSLDHQNENDNSLVLYGRIGSLNYLFMGDASKTVEKELLMKYDITCDVLKIGHHGSRTSTDPLFIQMLHPSIALISVKKNNRYHHPDELVMQTLKQYQIKSYLTSENGAVSIKSFLNMNFITTSKSEFGIIMAE